MGHTSGKHSVAAGVRAYLSLGSNIAPRESYLRAAVAELQSLGDLEQCSSIYETAPWGFNSSQAFLNMAVALRTSHASMALLYALQRIEALHGRSRAAAQGYQSRTLDIDILFYGHAVINTPQLHVPHPQLVHRNFVLVPLAEIAGSFIHPTLHVPVTYLCAQSTDTSEVKLYHDQL